jgi:hypothetical protein
MLKTANDAASNMTEVARSGSVVATFSEKDITRWGLPPEHRLDRHRFHDGEVFYGRLTCIGPVNNAANTWEMRGLSLKLPVEFNNHSRGKRVEVGIVARRGGVFPSEAMMVVFATQEAGNSGWRLFTLKSTFELLTLTYDVPATSELYSKHPILVIHSDANGTSKSADILGAYVKVAP